MQHSVPTKDKGLFTRREDLCVKCIKYLKMDKLMGNEFSL